MKMWKSNGIRVCFCIFSSAILHGVSVGQEEKYEIARRGNMATIRIVGRPTLIESLVKNKEPVELSPTEFAQLEAYLVATSQPRRMKNDRFYKYLGSDSENNATSNTGLIPLVLQDPIQVSFQFHDVDRARDWERLRMHFIYNAVLRKQKGSQLNAEHSDVRADATYASALAKPQDE